MDAEEGRSLLVYNAAGVQNGAATDALLLGYLHHIVGIAFVDDGKNHFMVVGRHGHSPLFVR